MGNVTRLNATLAPQKAARLRQAMSVPEGQDLGDFPERALRPVGPVAPACVTSGCKKANSQALASEAEASAFNITNPKPLPAEAYLGLLEESW